MDKDLTPLGELLESAREAVRPRLSQNAVAKHAQTSSTTYRRVITGIARLGGRDVPFDGNPDTIARIAGAVGVTPEQLEDVGRGDAAEELRRLNAERVAGPEGEGEGEGEDPFARMDRLYEDWKQDPERGAALRTILESWGERDAG